jgi:hypothetical protein
MAVTVQDPTQRIPDTRSICQKLLIFYFRVLYQRQNEKLQVQNKNQIEK